MDESTTNTIPEMFLRYLEEGDANLEEHSFRRGSLRCDRCKSRVSVAAFMLGDPFDHPPCETVGPCCFQEHEIDVCSIIITWKPDPADAKFQKCPTRDLRKSNR